MISLSHVDDFARACLDLWERLAPFGTYNVTNPGAVTTRQVAGMMRRVLKSAWHPDFYSNDDEFYGDARSRRAPAAFSMRQNC